MQEPELMYKLFDLVSDSLDEIISFLKSVTLTAKSTSPKDIIRKAVNCCKSIRNAIGQFSNEFEEDYELEEDEDSEDDFYLGNDFLDVVKAQRDRIDNLSIELDCLLEDVEWEFPTQIILAQASLDLAAIELQEIDNSYGVWKNSGHYESEIFNTIEYLDEVIEHLEECLDDSI